MRTAHPDLCPFDLETESRLTLAVHELRAKVELSAYVSHRVTVLTMLLLEVTCTSCCYHDLPLTAESSFLILMLYVSGTTCQLMWTIISVKSFVRAISRINFTIYCDFNV